MMAKDSVKRRLNGEAQDGMSFTEFTYQLLQGYDFLHLYETKNCKLQMGGSDQWGNITTGTELIRRKLGADNEAFALTCPLITKADGKKFGKTEKGNIWLDRNRTSPYTFYQFWLNVADEDAERYIKIFTSLDKVTIDALIEEHRQDPGRRVLQKRLAEEVTILVHSREDYELALEASNILFGKATKENLTKLDEQALLDVFSGVPQFEISRSLLEGEGIKAIDLLAEHTACFTSKGEMRKLTQGGGVSVNKEKLDDPNKTITTADLLDNKYILAQQGKKKYFLLIAK
jgi:tyrosyl-tRNA synthetase